MSGIENQNPITPGQQQMAVHSPIHDHLRQNNFSDLNNDELQVLVSLAINTLCDRGVSILPPLPPAPKAPDIFDNAKFKQIACTGIKLAYNGASQELIPFLNSLTRFLAVMKSWVYIF
jgi:hypothetical protein